MQNTDLVQKPSNLPLGLPALFEEMESQGILRSDVMKAAGLPLSKSHSGPLGLSVNDRLALYRAAQALARRADTGLRAGQRQSIGNFGVYGFALATSNTFADAFRFGREHIDLAGSVVRVTFEQRGETGILRSHNPRALGNILPFVAEFWRSSMSTLLSHILGERFPSTAMYFPYPSPDHGPSYERVFGCPVHFSSDVMEWHFEAKVLGRPCLNADTVTSNMCQDFCEQVVTSGAGQSRLQRNVRRLCLSRRETQVTAAWVARDLGLSLRTFYRLLSKEGVTFQSLQDETWRSIAIEYLENTNLSIEEIAHRCGYGDASNFRKAFRRWTGAAPSDYRQQTKNGIPATFL